MRHIVLLAFVVVAAVWCLDPSIGEEVEGKASAMRDNGLKYGFRYDPMDWAIKSHSREAVMVRVLVLNRPRPEDADVLEKEIDALLALQKPNGLWPKEHSGIYNHTEEETAAETIQRLLWYGCEPKRTEIHRALDIICPAQIEKQGYLSGRTLHVAVAAGWGSGDEPAKSVRKLAERVKIKLERGACPWSIGEARILWSGRTLTDTRDALTAELRWNAERMNSAGFNSYKDPWAYLEQAAEINHPLARQIAIQQVPMILRAQRADGGWGRNSLAVFRALVRHDLLEHLRRLPALPPDWEVVRSIPAPGKNAGSITWGDGKLWVHCPDRNQVIAVSPVDGKVLNALKIPFKSAIGIGWWDNCLAVTKGEPKEVVKLDPSNGQIRQRISIEKWVSEPTGVTQVGRKLWIADSWNWVVVQIDPDRPDKAEYILLSCPTGGMGTDLAASEDGIWHFDRSWHAIVKTSITTKPVLWDDKAAAEYHTPSPMDWGEKPFGGSTKGVAYDGKNLWVLDSEKVHICIIEKTQSVGN